MFRRSGELRTRAPAHHERSRAVLLTHHWSRAPLAIHFDLRVKAFSLPINAIPFWFSPSSPHLLLTQLSQLQLQGLGFVSLEFPCPPFSHTPNWFHQKIFRGPLSKHSHTLVSHHFSWCLVQSWAPFLPVTAECQAGPLTGYWERSQLRYPGELSAVFVRGKHPRIRNRRSAPRCLWEEHLEETQVPIRWGTGKYNESTWLHLRPEREASEILNA